ncbi:MAG: hypothetical protein ABI843_17730 [Dokdonella sp.]
MRHAGVSNVHRPVRAVVAEELDAVHILRRAAVGARHRAGIDESEAIGRVDRLGGGLDGE